MTRPLLHRFARQFSLLLFALLACSAALVAQSAEGASGDVERGHRAARHRSQQGDWKGARGAWLDLLREHAGAPEVRPFLPEIREGLRSAAFWSKRKRPDPKALVSGELLHYNPTVHKIKIAYGYKTRSDLPSLSDFGDLSTLALHPLRFKGNYSIEVEGDPRTLTKLSLLIEFRGDSTYIFQAGNSQKGARTFTNHTLHQLVAGKTELLESVKLKPVKYSGKPKNAKIKISVSKTTIKFQYNGKSLFSVRKEDKDFGQFGILELAKFEKLTLSGLVERSWIEGLIDASVQGERDAFEAAYTEPKELAAWGLVTVAEEGAIEMGELLKLLAYPDKFTPPQSKLLERLTELTNAGRFEAASARVAGLTDQELPAASKQFFLAMNWLRAKQLSRALLGIERLSQLKPLSETMLIVEAIMNVRCERYGRGLLLFEKLVEATPDSIPVRLELAELYLQLGRLDESRACIDAGLKGSPGSPGLLELRTQVAKASQGPSWGRAKHASGKFFEVGTDIDTKTTRLYSRAADQAMSEYIKRFGPLPEGVSKRPLYVFSGAQGYMAYISGIEAESGESTAGVFSPRLKQVLLWNQSERAVTLEVLRHEVLHSYTDQVLGVIPRWFAEGLAEYCAHARRPDGKWREGLDVPEHLAAIKRYKSSSLPLRQLLTLDDESFMRSAELCYPISWAFVRYLLHSTEANRAIFDKLWIALQGETDPWTAIHRVFDSVDLEQLDRDFLQDLNSRS